MFSRIKHVLKITFDLWEGAFASLAVFFTLWGLKELWEEEGRKKYNLLSRIGLTAFYIIHVVAIFLALGLLGEALISAPFATVLVGVTSVFNDGFDYFQEYYQKYKRNLELENLQNQLVRDNIDFKHNSTFFEDILERQDEIDILKCQQEELIVYLSIVESNSENTQVNIHQVKSIARALKEKCDSIKEENALIKDFYKIYHRNNFDEYQVIKNTEKEINVVNNNKEMLRKEIATLKAARVPNFHRIEQIKVAKRVLDAKIKKLAILNQYFYKLHRSKTTIQDLKDQLKNLDKKYRKPPFNEFTFDENVALKKIEADYLKDRIKSLKRIVNQAMHLDIQYGKTSLSEIEMKDYDRLIRLEQSPNKDMLKRILEQQIKSMSNMLKVFEKSLEDKRKYVQMIAINPREQLPEDLSKVFNTTKAIIDIDKQIELAKVEEKQKLFSTRLSVATAGIAIVLFYSSIWIVSSVLDSLLKAVSVISGIATMMGFVEKRAAKNRVRSLQTQQIDQLILDCKNRTQNIRDPKSRSALDNTMGDIIEQLAQNQADEEADQRSIKASERMKGFHHQYTRQRSSHKLSTATRVYGATKSSSIRRAI